jgi:sugar lactone lactonase YvrE
MRSFTVFFAVCLSAQAQCTLRTLVGSPTSAAGDGGAAVDAQFFRIGGVDRGADGALYVGDSGNGRIRLINPDGIVSTIAGGGTSPPSDGVLATEAVIIPVGVRLGPDGAVYFVDRGPVVPVIRRITTEGTIQTLPGTEDALSFSFDQGGNLWFSGWSGSIKRMDKTGEITLLSSPVLRTRLPVGAAIPLSETHFSYPADLQHSGKGNLYVQDGWEIYEIDPEWNVRLVLGRGSESVQNLADGAPATGVVLLNSYRYVIDDSGAIVFMTNGTLWEVREGIIHLRSLPRMPRNGLYGIAGLSPANGDALYLIARDQIFKMDSEGVIQPIAGRAPDYDVLGLPRSLAFDPAGNLFFADFSNLRVRKITPAGEITTVFALPAPPPNVGVSSVEYIAVDHSGTLFVLHPQRGLIVRITADGVVTEIPRPPTINSPSGLAADSLGNVYTRDERTGLVWQWNPQGSWNGYVTIRDLGSTSYPRAGLIFDSRNNLYAWDDWNGGYAFMKTGPNAQLIFLPHRVNAIAPAADGSVYIADERTRIWKWFPTGDSQLIAADATTRAEGEDGIASGCTQVMTLDPAGNLVFSDTCHNRIRMLEGPGDCAPLPTP